MRVLVTGSAGHIGREQARLLQANGYEVRGFDKTARKKGDDWEHLPGDLRDLDTVRRAMDGVDAVIHAGAIPSDRRGSGEEVMETNVQGTWNILMACVEAGVERLVNFSSINALGCVGGYKIATRLPVEDAYPRHPYSPYQISKHVGEEMCRAYSARHDMTTISLRPTFVASAEHCQWIRNEQNDHLERWKVEYWAYVDCRDVCEAGLLALTVQGVKNDAFLLSAADTTKSVPTAELVERYLADIPWITDKEAYLAAHPHRSLVDTSHAEAVLGWRPKHSWRDAS